MVSTSSPSVVVRPFQYGDEKQVKRLLHQATLGTTWPMFFSFARREIISQSILILAAVLFVVVGLPLAYSLISIPIVLLLLAMSTWTGHRLKILLTHNDLNDIGQSYQSNAKCGFWVAEVLDKNALISTPNKAKIVRKENEKSRHDQGLEIIGTIAVTIKEDPDLREPPESVAWLRRMAVSPKYHRKGLLKQYTLLPSFTLFHFRHWNCFDGRRIRSLCESQL